jgi:DNA-directed RNA polymerase subunit RPC12/RpoP
MNNNKYVCEKCNKEFKAQWLLDRHMKNIKPCVRQEEYTCHICKKLFKKKSHLDNHLNKKNSCAFYAVFEKISNITEHKENEMEKIISKINDQLVIPEDPNINAKNFNGEIISNNSQNHSNNTTNTTNSNNNSNNTSTMNNMSNSYLIQYVINNYPNAKNIEDCIKIENIPKMTLTDCKDLYFTDGAMKIFKGLCDLGEENRPIHCTDASRGNYIYKTNDVWKIDIGGEEIRNYFFPVIQEAYTQVHKSRIKDNPGNSTIIGNYLTEMTGTNVKKVCQKTLKRLSNHFLAKNSKNSRLMHIQNRKLLT